MRTHRVYTDAVLEPGAQARLGGNPAHYLGRVLRVAVGQTVVLFNGDGHEYVSEIAHVDRQCVRLTVLSRLPGIGEPAVNVTLVQAISRGERMDHTLQKCTELGAKAFQPIVSERVEVRLKGEKAARRQAHWQGVVVSACEQSGRSIVPPVHGVKTLAEWLDQPGPGMRLVLAPGADRRLVDLEFEGVVELAVGPEGGFSEEESRLMSGRNVQPVSFGPRILRTETAGPAAMAVIQALVGMKA